ncbi:MAG: sugar phosphate isomerase/epimerase [Verrucomicrobiae bacterium]|nr:sugar phosphate isomerase/epimerase [Verrucomicrobiae bacterium]
MSISLSFSTLACFDWPWNKIVDHAAQWGFQGIEVRFVNNVRDIAHAPDFLPAQIGQTKAEAEKRGLKICCVDSSAILTNSEAVNLEHGRRCIEIAQGLGSPFVRIFGGKPNEGMSFEENMDLAAEKWIKLADYGQSRDVEVLIEAHDHFTKSDRIQKLLKRVNHPSAGVLWDIHNPFRQDGEPVATFWQNLGAHVRHVHVKDSKGDKKSFAYCPCGEGNVPLREAVVLMKKAGWEGCLSVEWELAWHPELAPAAEIMPQYRQKLLEYLAG